MIEIIDKMKCSGCSSCFNACPTKAIEMMPDHEGFLYPKIKKDKCIRCNKCEHVCPYHNKVERPIDLEVCYAAYNKNEEERAASSSGGIFILLAKQVIQEGGIVFGAAYDENYEVYHTCAENEEELTALLGSKYMQSRIGTSFAEVQTQLNMSRKVLFVGSACQVGGLRGYLNKEYSNLICVDFICLGVPSPKVWRDYLTTYFNGETIKYVNFKNKKLGWHTFSLCIKTQKQNFCKNGRETLFFSGYFMQLYSRPSCSSCIFKEGNRVSDITISDCWGYTYIAPEMDDNKGLSSIECHTEQGMELFDSIKKFLVWKDADIADVKKYNSNYCTSAPIGKHRDAFWASYDAMPKEKLFKKYCSPQKNSLLRRTKEKAKKQMKNFLGENK